MPLALIDPCAYTAMVMAHARDLGFSWLSSNILAPTCMHTIRVTYTASTHTNTVHTIQYGTVIPTLTIMEGTGQLKLVKPATEVLKDRPVPPPDQPAQKNAQARCPISRGAAKTWYNNIHFGVTNRVGALGCLRRYRLQCDDTHGPTR